NEFTGENDLLQPVTNIGFDMPTGGNWSDPLSGPNNIFIYRNYLVDNLTKPGGNTTEDHHIYFHPSKPDPTDVGEMLNVVIEYNLINAGSQRARGFYMK